MPTHSKKLSVDEMLRLACIYAEQDRESLIAAHSHMQDDPACVRAKEFLEQLREYRKRRWGKKIARDAFDGAKSVPLSEIVKGANP